MGTQLELIFVILWGSYWGLEQVTMSAPTVQCEVVRNRWSVVVWDKSNLSVELESYYEVHTRINHSTGTVNRTVCRATCHLMFIVYTKQHFHLHNTNSGTVFVWLHYWTGCNKPISHYCALHCSECCDHICYCGTYIDMCVDTRIHMYYWTGCNKPISHYCALHWSECCDHICYCGTYIDIIHILNTGCAKN
jgi:hypothetical protein